MSRVSLKHSRGLALGLVVLGVTTLVAAPRDSAAQSCGTLGQVGCGVFKSDCAANLILYKGRCQVRGACGADGQRPCLAVPLERIPSCNGGLVELSGMCVASGQCGNENQRACLAIERFPSCNNKNLVERAGNPAMCVHPPCGRAGERVCNIVTERPGGTSCDVGLGEASGKCIDRASLDCGRMGQRACTLSERTANAGRACDAGLDEAPGCVGECRGSSGMCFNKNLPMTEPGVNMQRALPSMGPMRGYADLHVHMFGHLALGGGVIAGAPYDPVGGAARALAPDYGTNLDLVLPTTGTNQPVIVCPPLVPNCGRNIFHGDHILPADDFMGMNGDASKSYFGAPIFSGWPKWHSVTHQQVYYKWLERAWRGGLRAMVMLAVSNEFACSMSKKVRGTICTNSMANIDQQLEAAKAFAQWHATQPGGGWFKIVKTPEEAEQTIRAGNLAVVLGIEPDVLFGCRPTSTHCTEAYVSSKVDEYYAKDVRYVFPIHDFDTAFGGSALFKTALSAANLTIAGSIFVSAPCPGVSDVGTLNCNVRGLTPIGTTLINKMMDKGMMIDIDHASAKMIDDMFAVADRRGGYPFFVGHGLFGEVYAPTATRVTRNRHERMRTAAQLAKLKQLGSLVSVMTEDELETSQTKCKNSSVSFAQNYNYAVSKMGVVALGSDFNGSAGHVGPRFGDDACGREAAQGTRQVKRLTYPIKVDGFGMFDKQYSGQRTFDFNVDGLAHIGLYPDFLADLLTQTDATVFDVEPLMRSAAELVATWRRAQSKAASPSPAPSIQKLPQPTPTSPKLAPAPTSQPPPPAPTIQKLPDAPSRLLTPPPSLRR